MRLPAVLVLAVALCGSFGASAARAEPRLALVIGQGAYPAGELATAVNDAALVGQTLQSAGFEVVQGRDLGQNDLRRIIRDFLDGLQTATPDATVVVYIAGHALQLEGENYLVPIDARISRDSDIPIEGYRVSDIVRSLSAVPGAVRMVILDAGHEYQLPPGAQSIARGLAVAEPPPGFLIAFSAAPSTLAPAARPPYGPYATALIEMMREPGLAPGELFSRVRLRVHETTGGRETPWHADNLKAPFAFFEPVEATAAAAPPQPRRIASVSPEEAYAIAVERDTIQAYQEFLSAFADHPLARRVKVLLAARREALVWRRTLSRNTPEAYWSYLKRYANGPHVADARRRLTRLSAPTAPPPDFDEVVYSDLPRPLPAEIAEVRETIYVSEGLPPPPPAPVYLLPPRDEVIVRLEPPPPAPMAGILPIPIPIPIPVRARPPAEFRAPIAPLTPQGPMTIPVVDPPMAQPAQPGRPGQIPQQTTAGGRPAQASLAGQPGLRAPIAPIVPQSPGAASAPGGSGVAPGAALPARPSSLGPARAPDAASRGSGPGGAPAPLQGSGPPSAAAAPGQVPASAAGRPGAIPLTSSPPPEPPRATPSGAAAGQVPPGAAPTATAVDPAQKPAGAANATEPQTKPANAGRGVPPGQRRVPAAASASPMQGRQPARSVRQSTLPGPAPMRVPGAAGAATPPGAARAAAPGRAPLPGDLERAQQRPIKPAGPDGVQVQRPAPLGAVARPGPPPGLGPPAVPRPATPTVAQPPRPAGPAQIAQPQRPTGPASAQAPPPRGQAQPGNKPKCVLPNGQPCPPPQPR